MDQHPTDLPLPNTPTDRDHVRRHINRLKDDLYERRALDLKDPDLLNSFCDRMSALARWVGGLPPHERPIDPLPLVSLVQGVVGYGRAQPSWCKQFPQGWSGALHGIASWDYAEILRRGEPVTGLLDFLLGDLDRRDRQPLEVSFSPSEAPAECSIRLVGDVWYLRYPGDKEAHFARTGNQAIGWLAKLLDNPGELLTVAQMLGDPEGRIELDAGLGISLEEDVDYIKNMRRRLEDIQELDPDGKDERLQNEQADLVQRLTTWMGKNKQIPDPLRKNHSRIAGGLRNFCRTEGETKGKLVEKMPNLADHLTASLDLALPCFLYKPPSSHPKWKVEV